MPKQFLIGLSIIICLLFTSSLRAQDYRISGKSISELKETSSSILPQYQRPIFSSLKIFNKTIDNSSVSKTIPTPALPKAWKYEDLAFFCRLEVKMEKAAKFPIKFRLGEVQYVEKMEGKY
jgi:hypothetical protein